MPMKSPQSQGSKPPCLRTSAVLPVSTQRGLCPLWSPPPALRAPVLTPRAPAATEREAYCCLPSAYSVHSFESLSLGTHADAGAHTRPLPPVFLHTLLSSPQSLAHVTVNSWAAGRGNVRPQTPPLAAPGTGLCKHRWGETLSVGRSWRRTESPLGLRTTIILLGVGTLNWYVLHACRQFI